MKKISLTIMLLFCSIIFAQEQEENQEDNKKERKNIPAFRVGVKLGIPNGIGGNIEYVTPLLGQRVALYGDYSGFSATFDDVKGSLKYFEIGTNVYIFGNSGSGFYGSLGYGDLTVDGTYSDAQTIGGEDFTGEAEGTFEVSTLNVKAGFKIGKRIYFRTELGYGFGDVPQEIVITGEVNGVPAAGVEEIPNIPGLSESGYVLANIGIGIAF